MESSAPRSKSAGIRWLVAFAVALFFLLLTASLFLAGPQVQADEGSYLLNAATIAGRIASNPHYGYYSGYSLLLAPVFLLLHDAYAVYHGALLMNAVLLATTPFALYSFTRVLWPETDARTHALAAMGASLYSPVLVLSQFTMSEAALVPAFAWLVASGAATLERERLAPAVALGSFGGILFLVHPRGALMALPLLVALSAFAAANRRGRLALCVAWLVFIAVSALHAPLEQLAGRASHGGGYSLRLMLSRLSEPHNWPWIGANFIGAATEAIVTSFGLVVLAARCIGREWSWTLRDRSWWRSPRIAVLTGCAACCLAALLVTAAFFARPERADQLAYGRYALPTLLPLLALALVRLQAHIPSRGDLAWMFGAGLIGIAVSATAFGFLPAAAQANWNFINSAALFVAQRYVPLPHAWASIAIWFCGSMLVSAWATRLRSPLGIGTFAVMNLLIATLVWMSVTLPMSRSYFDERPIIVASRAIDHLSNGRLRIVVASGVDSWEAIDLQSRLFPQLRPCGSGERCLVGSVRPLGSSMPSAERLVAIDPPSPLGSLPTGLYIPSGPESDAYAREHETPANEGFEPLTYADRVAAISVDLGPTEELRVRTGEPLELRVRVTNLGTRALAGPASKWLPLPIRLGARADLPGGRHEYRGLLDAPLAPGATGLGRITIGPFTDAGRYRLELGMLQERVAWFDGVLDTVVVVRDR